MPKKSVPKPPRAAKVKPSNMRGGTKTGSARVRMFKVLSQVTYPTGMSVGDLRTKCGFVANSGHILTLVVDEVKRGRFLKWSEPRGPNGVATNVYCLTPAGLRDYVAKTIDFTTYAGRRIGVTRPRGRGG